MKKITLDQFLHSSKEIEKHFSIIQSYYVSLMDDFDKAQSMVDEVTDIEFYNAWTKLKRGDKIKLTEVPFSVRVVAPGDVLTIVNNSEFNSGHWVLAAKKEGGRPRRMDIVRKKTEHSGNVYVRYKYKFKVL